MVLHLRDALGQFVRLRLQRSSGFLPNGTYYVRLSIQKALGDNANPAHWETWTSPVITVDRNGGGGEPLP